MRSIDTIYSDVGPADGPASHAIWVPRLDSIMRQNGIGIEPKL